MNTFINQFNKYPSVLSCEFLCTEVYLIQPYVMEACQWFKKIRWLSPSTHVVSWRNDIAYNDDNGYTPVNFYIYTQLYEIKT
jgi:hypothetical protein